MLFFALLSTQSLQATNPVKPAKDPFLVTGYLNSSWVKPTTDLEFIKYLDRIFFFGLSPDSEGRFTVSDAYIKNYELVRSKMNKNQKILLVVGGGGLVANMHVMGDNPEKRELFVKELVAFAKKYKFDGIDMDWETDWKSKPAKKVSTENLIALLTSIKGQMPKNSILTAALGGSSGQQATDISGLVEDVSVMLYSTLNKEGLHAPLYTVKERLENYTKSNYPNNRLLIGVPFYGRHADRRTQKYYQFADKLAGNQVISIYDGFSFNSAEVMREKVRYFKEAGYKGIMIWELTQDVPYSNPMSLLRAIYEEAKK